MITDISKKDLNLFLKNHFNHVSRSSFKVDFTPLSLIKWSMVILTIWLRIIQMTINCVLRGSMKCSFDLYWRGFSPKKNGRKSRKVGLLSTHINWETLNPIPNIMLKKWNNKKKGRIFLWSKWKEFFWGEGGSETKF